MLYVTNSKRNILIPMEEAVFYFEKKESDLFTIQAAVHGKSFLVEEYRSKDAAEYGLACLVKFAECQDCIRGKNFLFIVPSESDWKKYSVR